MRPPFWRSSTRQRKSDYEIIITFLSVNDAKPRTVEKILSTTLKKIYVSLFFCLTLSVSFYWSYAVEIKFLNENNGSIATNQEIFPELAIKGKQSSVLLVVFTADCQMHAWLKPQKKSAYIIALLNIVSLLLEMCLWLKRSLLRRLNSRLKN